MDTESFARVGPTLTKFVLGVEEGREDPNNIISSGLSLARQQNAI